MKRLNILLLLLFAASLCCHAQKRKIHNMDFALDPTDISAQSQAHRRDDGSGYWCAIIKVTSSDEDDRLNEYRFDFGMLNCIPELHEDEGELWLYVQKNAKRVKIMRTGFAPYEADLGCTIEAGRNYRMRLSVQAQRVRRQMLLFKVTPPESRATIVLKSESDASVEETMHADDEGSAAKNMLAGSYLYKVFADGYHSEEGRVTLDGTATKTEPVTLRAKFSTITLVAQGGAQIYVDGEYKGAGSWTGRMDPGPHSVECRLLNHKPSLRNITVEENKPMSYTLDAPVPILGTLSVISSPLGAKLLVDGKDRGVTPLNIDLVVGAHKLQLTKDGYDQRSADVNVVEGETVDVNIALTKSKPAVKPVVLNSNGLEYNPSTRSLTYQGREYRMVYVQGGTFTMGATSEQGSDAYDDEKPAHSVTLGDYYMGATEVPQWLWKAVMGSNPSYFAGDNRPVEKVSWNDCQGFISRLNSMTGASFSLPTEAQWEYAARGGGKSRGYKYSGSNTLGNVAWYDDNSGSATRDVGTKWANELGLYDMSGNVWEWCADWFGSYSSSAVSNPTGPASGSYRVYRGGSWCYNARNCRVSSRGGSSPTLRSDYLGLRLALRP